jgi:hypothetical protein
MLFQRHERGIHAVSTDPEPTAGRGSNSLTRPPIPATVLAAVLAVPTHCR